MKARNIIGTLLICGGLFLALCTADGSRGEITLRFAGIAGVAAGAAVGDFFDTDKKNEDDDYSKHDDHNPYPEE